jgi:hypothetical protein
VVDLHLLHLMHEQTLRLFVISGGSSKFDVQFVDSRLQTMARLLALDVRRALQPCTRASTTSQLLTNSLHFVIYRASFVFNSLSSWSNDARSVRSFTCASLNYTTVIHQLSDHTTHIIFSHTHLYGHAAGTRVLAIDGREQCAYDAGMRGARRVLILKQFSTIEVLKTYSTMQRQKRLSIFSLFHIYPSLVHDFTFTRRLYVTRICFVLRELWRAFYKNSFWAKLLHRNSYT